MVDVKEAAKKAVEFFDSLVADYRSLRVEEVSLSEDDQYWLITLGFEEPSLPAIGKPDRYYKILKVRADNGEVVSMTIRVLDNV